MSSPVTIDISIVQGTSAKADVPRRYLGKRVYVIIAKSEGKMDQE
ncbi:MAG: DUF2080 family transposase-associated protein [Thermoplasmata archaeon]